MSFRSTVVRHGSPAFRLKALFHPSMGSKRAFHMPNPPIDRPFLTRRSLWIGIPLLGGALFYSTTPAPSSPVPIILASPTVIPCKSRSNHRSFIMSSTNETHMSTTLLQRLITFLRDRIWEPLRTGARFLHLFVLFTPVLLTAPMLLVGPKPRSKNGDRWGAIWWYGFLVAQMNRAGPTFIKLAQWAGSRADLFPAKMCEQLGQLHSNGKPHSLRHTKRVIEHAFKRPFSEVFEHFEEEPIGIGAIAQVYRAILNPELVPTSYLDPRHKVPSGGGSPRALVDAAVSANPNPPPPTVPSSVVAIKVLHPRVAPMIRRDLAIMTFFATWLSYIPGIEWLSLQEEVEVFGRMMNDQLDLRHEAAHLRTFEKNFSERRSAVTFPRPMEDFTSAEVLVEEYQNALPLEAFLRNGGGSFDNRLANMGLDAFLNMLLLDNFVHSDLHPGNIMVKFYKPTTKFVLQSISASIFNTAPPVDTLHPSSIPNSSNSDSTDSKVMATLDESDAVVARLRPHMHDPDAWHAELDRLNAEGYQPSLVFIDAGLVTTLNEDNRKNFLDLFRAIATFDGYRAGELMVDRCRTPHLVIDRETFALKIQHLVLGVKSKTFSLAKIKISDILTQVLLAVREHHVKMEADFINTVLAVLLLEGIGRQLDPNMDLFKSSLPILRQLGRQMSAKEAMNEVGSGNIAAMLKIWVWIEARELAGGAVVNVDDMIKYDWLSPNI